MPRQQLTFEIESVMRIFRHDHLQLLIHGSFLRERCSVCTTDLNGSVTRSSHGRKQGQQSRLLSLHLGTAGHGLQIYVGEKRARSQRLRIEGLSTRQTHALRSPSSLVQDNRVRPHYRLWGRYNSDFLGAAASTAPPPLVL